MYRAASFLRPMATITRNLSQATKSPLLFNGCNRTIEPGATYVNPNTPNIQLKMEEDFSQINASNRFSIYIPKPFNGPIEDAYDTDKDLLKFTKQFDVRYDSVFIFDHSPGTVLAPGASYEIRLLNRQIWFFILVIDEAFEILAASADDKTQMLCSLFLSNTRDIITGRQKIHDLTKYSFKAEDLKLCLELENLTMKLVKRVQKILDKPVLEHWYLAEDLFFDNLIKERTLFTCETTKKSLEDVLMTRQSSCGLNPHIVVNMTAAELKYVQIYGPYIQMVNAIMCLDNCIVSYCKEVGDGQAVCNSVEALIRMDKLSPEDAMAVVVSKRNELMRGLELGYDRASFDESRSATLKAVSTLVGAYSCQINSQSRYGWVNQNRPSPSNEGGNQSP